MFTVDDARRYLLDLMPPGFEELYDLTPGIGDVYQLFDAFGATFKQFVFDAIDTLRTEIFPPTAAQKLPDWEAATGIANLAPALFGATAQRQQAVVAKLREFGPWCDPVVQSVLQPLLGYFPATVPQVVKCPRAAIDTAHTYSGGALFCPRNAVTQGKRVETTQGGVISRAGARFYMTLAAPLPTDALTDVGLQAPDGSIHTWVLKGDGATTSFLLFAPDLAGKPMLGVRQWSLQVLVGSLTTDVSISEWHFIVDGIGPGIETGGAIFTWGVFADPAHLAESGVPADFTAARLAIARIEHSEARGDLLLALGPDPDVATAIPDACIPA